MSPRKVTPKSNPEWVRAGATLRALREARGLTADALATSIGKSRPYLANIEAGRKPLTAGLAKELAERLAVPPAALLSPLFFADEVSA